MEQRKLLKTIETVTSKKFASEKELLAEVIDQIVDNEQIEITGGRVWRLDALTESYKILIQTGNVQKISEDFTLPIKEYPVFEEISKERTILADETNKTLIQKGILKYSASGVGSKIKVNGD